MAVTRPTPSYPYRSPPTTALSFELQTMRNVPLRSASPTKSKSKSKSKSESESKSKSKSKSDRLRTLQSQPKFGWLTTRIAPECERIASDYGEFELYKLSAGVSPPTSSPPACASTFVLLVSARSSRDLLSTHIYCIFYIISYATSVWSQRNLPHGESMRERLRARRAIPAPRGAPEVHGRLCQVGAGEFFWKILRTRLRCVC
eukprot:SAG11_NODE_1247_length_5401_cov_2.372878_5_plen_203_part_00